ncbi:hypothetical protein AAZX31_12G049400 [Glycine max]
MTNFSLYCQTPLLHHHQDPLSFTQPETYPPQAFVNSYHFNLERNNGSIKEKLKKSVKEVNEAAMRIFLGMSQRVYKRRLGIRAYRVTMTLPSTFLVTIRCFMPWLNKREIMKSLYAA